MDTAKAHGLNISLSTVATIAALVPMFWFVAKPILIAQISTALASEFEETIDTKTEGVTNAFKALLRSEITALRKEIAKLQTHQNDADWTEDDAEYLTELRIELEALQEAYDEL